jgi:N-acetylmuramoyl-L-alanine amidase
LTAAASSALWPRLAGAATAQTLRLHAHPAFTRLVVELSAPVDFKVRRLTEPYRLAIDVPGLAWSAPEGGAPTGLISKVQYLRQTSAEPQISVALTGPARVLHAFLLPATATTPTRLVVDLEPTTAEAFLAGAEAPAAKAVPVVAKAPPARPAPRRKVVALDPGHGGIDPGAIGFSGIYEKEITLAAARQLGARLEATGRYRVILTRHDDSSLALRQRTELARKGAADLFISLHADSIRDPGVRGLSVYTLSERASDAEAEALAARENQADSIIGLDLSHETAEVRGILVDLAQRESRNLATHFAGRLIGQLQREVRLLPNTHRFAGFAVLKSPDIPSVLIEMGYLSNREDEAALKKEGYRTKLMTAVLRGVDQYFASTLVARQL